METAKATLSATASVGAGGKATFEGCSSSSAVLPASRQWQSAVAARLSVARILKTSPQKDAGLGATGLAAALG
jgi:hypothetical protein